jgi:hypothetical protein
VDPDGKKTRVANTFVSQCDNKKIVRSCKTYVCRRNNKNTYPCKVKRTIFTDKKDVKGYCKTITKGPYSPRNRAEVARRANEELNKEMAQNALLEKKHIHFDTTLPADKPKTKIQSIRRKARAEQSKSQSASPRKSPTQSPRKSPTKVTKSPRKSPTKVTRYPVNIIV